LCGKYDTKVMFAEARCDSEYVFLKFQPFCLSGNNYTIPRTNCDLTTRLETYLFNSHRY